MPTLFSKGEKIDFNLTIIADYVPNAYDVYVRFNDNGDSICRNIYYKVVSITNVKNGIITIFKDEVEAQEYSIEELDAHNAIGYLKEVGAPKVIDINLNRSGEVCMHTVNLNNINDKDLEYHDIIVTVVNDYDDFKIGDKYHVKSIDDVKSGFIKVYSDGNGVFNAFTDVFDIEHCECYDKVAYDTVGLMQGGKVMSEIKIPRDEPAKITHEWVNPSDGTKKSITKSISMTTEEGLRLSTSEPIVPSNEITVDVDDYKLLLQRAIDDVKRKEEEIRMEVEGLETKLRELTSERKKYQKKLHNLK